MASFRNAALDGAALAALDRQDALEGLTGDDRSVAIAWLERLRAAGLNPRAYEPSLYASVPERSELLVDGSPVECWPAAFSGATGGARVEGSAARVHIDASGSLAGRVAVVQAPVEPGTVYALEHRGAVAQVFIAGDAVPRDVSASTVWGSPTHESIARRPRTPIVSVFGATGERLLRALRDGAPASVATWTSEGWVPLLVPAVDVRGMEDADEFVLLHGGDAAALAAMARALHHLRGDLRRSVRIVWWPARAVTSHGASAWYADAHAAEIDDACIAHVCVEPPADAKLTEVSWMSEGAELCLDAIADAGAGPVKGRRPARASDYSFNQIGVSGVFGGRRFERDLHAYMLVVTRLVTAPLYPLDFTAPVLEMGAAVQRYQAAAGNELDLRGVSQDLGTLRRAISAWRSDADAAVARHQLNHELRRRANATLRRLARVLVPLGYARGERFDHDPALRFSAVPRLEAALHVASASESLKPFIRTALVREQNKVRGAIREAGRLIAESRTA